jgi:hypothetical protein
MTSRLMREASVHTGRTRDATPAAPGHLGNEHTAVTVEPASTRRCAKATTLGVGDATIARRIGAPRPNH